MYEGTSCFNIILLFWTSLNSYPPFHLNENTNHFRWLISEECELVGSFMYFLRVGQLVYSVLGKYPKGKYKGQKNIF